MEEKKTKRTYDTWKPEEKEYLVENINKLPLSDIYAHFCTLRSRMSVDLKIKRMRLTPVKTVEVERVNRNLIIEMLRQRIGDPKNFQPQRDFFERSRIGQKRFWQLYRGEKNLTETEYKALALEWNVSLEDAFNLRQLELSFNFTTPIK